jgi:hypothetical protein
MSRSRERRPLEHSRMNSGRVLMPLEATGINSRLRAVVGTKMNISVHFSRYRRSACLFACHGCPDCCAERKASGERECRLVSPSIVAGPAAPGSPEKSSEDLEVGRSAEAVSRFPPALRLSRCSAFAHVSRFCRRVGIRGSIVSCVIWFILVGAFYCPRR